MGTDVDVVILSWNDGPLLAAAVGSALNSRGVEVRVFVVDNGSELLPDLPADARVTLLANKTNRGVAAGRNQGAAATGAPFLCFLDSDAQLQADTLAKLIDACSANSDVALVAPVFNGQRPEDSGGRAPSLADKVLRVLNLRTGYRSVPATGSSWDVDFAIGACQLVRRADFLEAGGFDESYFYGPEDVDLCLRLRKRGLRVLQVAAAGCHHPPRRRCRGLLTKRGIKHGRAVIRHLWRHSRFRERVATA